MLKLLHCYFNHLNFPQVKIFVYLYLRPYSRILADIMQITTDFIHACKEFYRAWITLITHLNVVVHCCLRRVALHCWTPLWALFYVWLRGDNFSLSLLFAFFLWLHFLLLSLLCRGTKASLDDSWVLWECRTEDLQVPTLDCTSILVSYCFLSPTT